MNLFTVAGCANHWLWKQSNKSCLLILINHKPWRTVNMFQQHYQRRGGFLLFLPLRENIVITPWRCKWAKLFRLLLFHDIWTKIYNLEAKKKVLLSIIHMLMCAAWEKGVTSAIQHVIIVYGAPVSWWRSFICLVNDRRVTQCSVCLLKGVFSQQNVN